MRQFWTGLLIISMCVIIGCSSPVGSISSAGNGDGSSKYDFIMLRPNRILYEINNDIDVRDRRFDRSVDLRVFVADSEGYRSIDPMDPDLLLEVIMYPGLMGETSTVISNGYFPFSEPGRHLIRGTYDNKTDEYSIEVRGSVVNPGPGGGFVDMIWLD